MIARARARWSALGLRGRIAVVAAFALIVLGPCVRPAIARLAPRIAVAAATIRPGNGGLNVSGGRLHGRFDVLDPWDHGLAADGAFSAGGPRATLRFYSVGPDGVDESGLGDDVVPDAVELWLGRRVAGQPGGLVSTGLLLLWAATSRGLSRPRSPRLKIEVVRALLNAFIPAVLSFGVAQTLLGPDLSRWVDDAGVQLPSVVHPALALVGTVALLCFLLVFAWRLSRPLEGEDVTPAAGPR